MLPALVAARAAHGVAGAAALGAFFVLLARGRVRGRSAKCAGVSSTSSRRSSSSSRRALIGRCDISTPERLYAALAIYGAFGLLFLAVPALADASDARARCRDAAHARCAALVSLPMLLVHRRRQNAAGVSAVAAVRRAGHPRRSRSASTSLYLAHAARSRSACAAPRSSCCCRGRSHAAAADGRDVGAACHAARRRRGRTSWLLPGVSASSAGATSGLGECSVSTFARAAVAALFLGHVVAIAAGMSAEPALFVTLLWRRTWCSRSRRWRWRGAPRCTSLALWSVRADEHRHDARARRLTPGRAFVVRAAALRALHRLSAAARRAREALAASVSRGGVRQRCRSSSSPATR